ncbi:MAG: hypothetical protein PHQ96_02915 [Candidatus Omnitrophica bacterium]|nr:hypothetical protein [Candidatus Omnitrophota bacterium]
MKKTIISFLVSLAIVFVVYGDTAFEELCAIINNQGDPSQAYALDHELRHKFLSGRAYVVSVEKDVMGDVILHLSTTRSLLSDKVIRVTVYPKKSYAKEALGYRKGDYVYFDGTLGGISGIAHEITIYNAAISRFREVITR